MSKRVCPECFGEGFIVPDPVYQPSGEICPECDGAGEVEENPQTLVEARREMYEKVRRYKKSINCPCCNEPVAIRERGIHAEMILWLIGLYKLSGQSGGYHTTLEIVEISPHLKAGGTNGTLLIHWGLIEKIPKLNQGGAPAGSYRITSKGEDFLLRGLKIPKKAFILQRKVEGYSEDLIAVQEALGNKFNYEELMSS